MERCLPPHTQPVIATNTPASVFRDFSTTLSPPPLPSRTFISFCSLSLSSLPPQPASCHAFVRVCCSAQAPRVSSFHCTCSSGEPPVGETWRSAPFHSPPLSRVLSPVSVCLVRTATSATAPCVCGCHPAYHHRQGLACWKCVCRLCLCEHSWWSVSRVSCGQASLNWNECLTSGRLCQAGHFCTLSLS